MASPPSCEKAKPPYWQFAKALRACFVRMKCVEPHTTVRACSRPPRSCRYFRDFRGHRCKRFGVRALLCGRPAPHHAGCRPRTYLLLLLRRHARVIRVKRNTVSGHVLREMLADGGRKRAQVRNVQSIFVFVRTQNRERRADARKPSTLERCNDGEKRYIFVAGFTVTAAPRAVFFSTTLQQIVMGASHSRQRWLCRGWSFEQPCRSMRASPASRQVHLCAVSSAEVLRTSALTGTSDNSRAFDPRWCLLHFYVHARKNTRCLPVSVGLVQNYYAAQVYHVDTRAATSAASFSRNASARRWASVGRRHIMLAAACSQIDFCSSRGMLA